MKKNVIYAKYYCFIKFLIIYKGKEYKAGTERK